MEKKDILVIALVVLALGFNIYRRYTKKKGNANTYGNASKSSTAFPSSIKDDDYEPYSGK
jgi:hypothetical protein